ncbi:hypothetical protein F4780DRAFT_128640 [Xylariomycetidae sp. FL0641]|nr:hypothetical protein F4780DRAFT_128640 [Xylariomycetidae sp. FL0641]
MNGLAGAIAEGEGLFDTNHGHHMDARAALSTAESRKSDFFYTVFGDRGIDRAVNDCRANEEHWHRVADEAWANKENLRSLHQRLQPVLGNDLEGLVRNLGRLADQMRANYAKIGEDRTVDNDCWIAARTLQYHVATNTEYTNRDDALRHVLKLLSTANKTIAADSDVARLKQGMKKQIQDKLGVAKAAELEQEKTFLAKPEDVDF